MRSRISRPGLVQPLLHLRAALAALPIEALARRASFMRRRPRKIPIPDLLVGLCAVACESVLSLERIAAVIGLAAQGSYSKQALHQRLGPNFSSLPFLRRRGTLWPDGGPLARPRLLCWLCPRLAPRQHRAKPAAPSGGGFPRQRQPKHRPPPPLENPVGVRFALRGRGAIVSLQLSPQRIRPALRTF